jgi:hypothetical protein
MLAIDTLVPDFNRALESVPGGVEASRVLTETLREARLSDRTAALVRVAVAQRAGGPYAQWAMARLAARQWISAEDIFLATAGTARDAVESAIVKAASRMAARRRRAGADDAGMLGRLLGVERATEVVATIALAMLACEALAAIAPSTGTAQPSHPGA